jgi:uncharacterized protein HemY
VYGQQACSECSGLMLLGAQGPDERGEQTLSQRLRQAVAQLVADPIPCELLRKYIAYARKYVHPKLSPEAARILQQLYLKMRAEAQLGEWEASVGELRTLASRDIHRGSSHQPLERQAARCQSRPGSWSR